MCSSDLSIPLEKMTRLVSITRVTAMFLNRNDRKMRDMRGEGPDSLPGSVRFIIEHLERENEKNPENFVALRALLILLEQRNRTVFGAVGRARGREADP